MSKKVKWVKQLTRENTLLERSLRTIAYYTSIREIGRANFSQSPILGRGRITSLYYSPENYNEQQKIITREFRGKRIKSMGEAIKKYLEEGYFWSKESQNRKILKKDFLSYLHEYFKHHAHARGAIVYGYWGEPAITKKLKKSLSKYKNINPAELDHIISVLSTPVPVSGFLREIIKVSKNEINKKENLLKQLKLKPAEKELVEILSWFTFFYECGERVSARLYEQLVFHLKKIIKTKKEWDDLEWYDPYSLTEYLRGKKLIASELKNRKRLYVLVIKNNKLEVISGEKAQVFYDYNFREDLSFANKLEISGTVASRGQAKGRVKIIITQEDQKKMSQGDILVSTMTTPYLMSAVKRAVAIITDEGGLTAHAAIIARELNIPCVIGTKIATKVFKDGDLVEVDADKGIVRKIK